MQTFYARQFVLPLPEGHRFPMAKYAMLRERVAAELPGCRLRRPGAATDAALLRVHTAGYLDALVRGLERTAQRRIGFPWTPAMVERSRLSVGGTVDGARAALTEGVAVNLAGGTHHAYPDRGEGFCVFNDIAVAARWVQADGMADRLSVVDLDVHQGNGTAAIFRDDPSVFTVSVHGERNYPFRKESSDLDVPLPDGTPDAPYLEAVDAAVAAALDHAPALVFYLAGADPLAGDRLGRLSVSPDGLLERDRRVLEACATRGVPVVAVMGGGYGADVADTVTVHFGTVATALGIHQRLAQDDPYAPASSTSR